MSAFDHRMLVIALALTGLAALLVAILPPRGRVTFTVWVERRAAVWLMVAGTVTSVVILLTAPVRS